MFMRSTICLFLILFSYFPYAQCGFYEFQIPRKIWQTYKTKNLPHPALVAQETWISKNPEYDYNFYDDDDMESYIIENWDADTYAFFQALPLGVMKADLWRYLIIASEGGIYSDIDSICCAPIRKWTIKTRFTTNDILLLGVEHDLHFCQWTIAATKNHPAMLYVCDYIIEKWRQNGIDTSAEDIELTNLLGGPGACFVLATTGPAVWTDALLSYMNEENSKPPELYQKYLSDMQFKQKLNSLGIYLFSRNFYAGEASQNLYGSQNFGDGYIQWTKEAEVFKDNQKKE